MASRIETIGGMENSTPRRGIRDRLELFEVVGLAATAVVAVIFFAYAHRLDTLVGEPNYHWRMFFVIVGIYARFVPKALVVGGLLLAVAALVIRRMRVDWWRRLFIGVRIFIAYCLLLIAFRVVNFYVPAINPELRDTAVQHMDKLIFGAQVSYLLEPLARPWLTNVLTGAYVSWFWLLFWTIVVLILRDKRAASEYVFASLLCFYVGYVCYIFVPVIGPGYTLHYHVVLHDIAPVFTMNRLTIARDCFPSLHTAMSVLMAIYVWRYQRGWFIPYLILACLIIFATLYLRIHYGLDDIAGAALAVVVSAAAPAMHQKWNSR